jgi:hypothetical protein
MFKLYSSRFAYVEKNQFDTKISFFWQNFVWPNCIQTSLKPAQLFIFIAGHQAAIIVENGKTLYGQKQS